MFTELLSNRLLIFLAIGTLLYGLLIHQQPAPYRFKRLKNIYLVLMFITGGIGSCLFLFGTNFSLGISLVWLSLTFSLYLLAYGFELLIQRFPFKWLSLFFYLGTILTFLASKIMFTSPDIEDILLLPFLELLGLFIVWLLAIFANILQRYQPNFTPQAPHSKYQHYRDQGLDEQEIEFLREQLAPAKTHIETIEQAFQENAKLRAIELQYNTVKVCKQQFKDIVEEPKRLADASDFLYKYLPSLEDILQKYNEINGHITKNKQSYMIMERSREIIEQLCQKINEHYLQFHADTFTQMEDDLSLAERQLNNETIHDSIDNLFNL